MTAGLVYADGRAISPADVARVRVKSSLSGSNPGAFAYDAQQVTSQEMASWLPWLRSPDGEINNTRDRVVARARDLIRNDGYAAGAINRLLDAAVGAQFHPIPKPNWRALSRYCPAMDLGWATEFAAAVRSEYQLWADDPACWCDVERVQTVPQMLRLAFRHKIVDGDGLTMIPWDPDAVGSGAARYATRLHIIDPDRLSNEFQKMDTHSQRGGVEIDERGAPMGYYIRRAHQNDYYDAGESMIWDYFPRETAWGRPVVVHDFERERASQHRGNGLLTAVLSRFKMLTKFDAVTLQAAVLRTLVGFFVKSPYDAEQIRMAMESDDDSQSRLEPSFYQGMREAWHSENSVTMGGVRMPVMAPGESIETISGGEHATDFDNFQGAFLRSFAAATGQSVEEISGDFRKVNYSSARSAMLQSWRTLIRRRKDFAMSTATPIYGAWLEEALEGQLKGLLPRGAPRFMELRAAYIACEWIGPGRGWVDPVKEPQGEVLKLDAAFGTLAETTANISGRYYLDILDERQAEEAAMKERGLRLPAWAGDTPANEIGQKPSAIEAEELISAMDEQ